MGLGTEQHLRWVFHESPKDSMISLTANYDKAHGLGQSAVGKTRVNSIFPEAT